MNYLGLSLAVLVGVVFPLFLVAIVFINFIADFKGAPFVPTSGKLLDEILKRAKLKKGQKFIELGSGDGRVVREAVKKFGVLGVGVEFNPTLIVYSKLVSRGLKNIEFKRQNFFSAQIKDADIIFVFLLPKTLKKLGVRFLKECKKGTLIVSHGFRVPGFENLLIEKLEGDPFPTYYYRIS